jgi:hypothetical protein
MYFVQIAVLIAGSKSNWLDWLHVFNFNTASAFGGVCVAPLSPYAHLHDGALGGIEGVRLTVASHPV